MSASPSITSSPPDQRRTLDGKYVKDGLFRVLALDGGGAKGFYTLGVLKEIEGIVQCPLYHCFDMIYGTSTGSIIATLLALGYEVDQIRELYRTHVPSVMKPWWPKAKSAALTALAQQIYGEKKFTDVLTRVGVVSTKWAIETPLIFKGSIDQAHGRTGTFVPGFGATIADAVRASCSAYPFFKRVSLKLSSGDHVELVDGGYCANNPALYAIADAVVALKVPRESIRLVSLGVGIYPEPGWLRWLLKQYILSVRLLQKVLEINSQSMETLRGVLFRDIPTVRISDTFNKPEMATDLMEHDLKKLDLLYQRGRESFAERESMLRSYLIPSTGGVHGHS